MAEYKHQKRRFYNRGAALILNGGHVNEKDVITAKDVAETCGFHCFQGVEEMKTKMNKTEMHNAITTVKESLSKMKPEESCAFLCFILGRGEEGLVYDGQGTRVTTTSLIEQFHANECDALAGKPKIFIIDTVYLPPDEKKDGLGPKISYLYLPSDSDIFCMVSHLPRQKPLNEGDFGLSMFIDLLHKSKKEQSLEMLAKSLRNKLKDKKPDDIRKEQEKFIEAKAYPYTINTLRYSYSLEKPQYYTQV